MHLFGLVTSVYVRDHLSLATLPALEHHVIGLVPRDILSGLAAVDPPAYRIERGEADGLSEHLSVPFG